MSRNTRISLFVIAWLLVFHYETFRLNYLSPLAGRELPKLKFLFPPAGWIMFFNVDQSYGTAEVYGNRGGEPFFIDPHQIFRTRFVGYDNIHRNVMVGVLSPSVGEQFCGYLHRKFPQYDGFAVAYAAYPDVTQTPPKKSYRVLYQCQ